MNTITIMNTIRHPFARIIAATPWTRVVVVVLLLTIVPVGVTAQKKDIATARDQVKSGKNLAAAQASMEKLLRDSANRSNLKAWATLYDAVAAQYEQGNEKLYLKQQYDTAQIFTLAQTLFGVAEAMDSADAHPGRKGRVEPVYRKRHAAYLNRIRPNLYVGGTYFIRHKEYAKAYALLNAYTACASQPLFRAYRYAETDTLLPHAAYWAAYAAYKMKDAKATLNHAYWALKDTAHMSFMLQYLAETYLLEKDTARYVATLADGFARYPEFPFFFPRLVEHYAATADSGAMLAVIRQALAVNPRSVLFRFTYSTYLLNSGRYDACISLCDSLIAEGDTLPDVYYNAGLSWFNKAVELDKNVQRYKRNRDRILDDYRRALPYLVTFRRMAPQRKRLWALPLYTIYLNLNMGREFDEIDKTLRQ